MNKNFTALLLGLSLVLPMAGNADAAIILKASSTGNADSYATRAFVDMSKMLAEKSNGKYQLEVYDSAKLGNPDTVTQGIQFGTVHFMQEGTGNMTAFTPKVAFFDMPFVFKSIEEFRKVFRGPLGKKIAAEASTKTILYLGFSECGFRKMFTNKPVNSLAELQTKRIRTTLSKAHNATIKAMGINATPMAMMEVFTGIQQGVVDGIDLDLAWGQVYNMYEVAPFIYETDHLLTPQPIVTGTRWWNSLSEDDRRIMQECVDYYIERANFYYEEMSNNAREFMLNHGVKFTTPTPEDKQKLIDMVKPLWETLPDDQAALLKEIHETVAAN